MTYVYYGERRTGKTLAARGALQMFVTSFGGNMPSLLVESDLEFLSDRFRVALGAPSTLSNMEMLSGLCGTLRDHPLNSLRRCPPLIVIDGLGEVTEANYGFIGNLYKWAYEARILVFIFSDDELSANALCGMNGKERIQPLEGMFTTGADDTIWTIANNSTGNLPFARKIASGIVWNGNNWNAKKLSKLCKLRFPEFNFEQYKEGDKYTFVQEGDLPDVAVNRAAAIVANYEGNDESTEAMKQPYYDENDDF